MKTLILIRHAESDITNMNLSDHARSINSNGQNECEKVFKWINNNKINIDKLLVSSAVRAQETMKLIFPGKLNTFTNSKLYLCTKLELINIIKETDDIVDTLAVIGHEPSISETLIDLVGNTRPDLNKVLSNKYPTAALSLIVFNVVSWSNVSSKEGTFDVFLSPLMLDSE